MFAYLRPGDFTRPFALPLMKIGYVRVSTQDQQLHLQVDALQAAGCADLVQEKASSSKDRPQLQRLLTRLRAGDTLVV